MTVKTAHICFIFGTTKILSRNLPLPDELSYACSFFIAEQGNWLTALSATPHPDKSFVISLRRCCHLLFTEPLRQQAELYVETSNSNLQMQLICSRKVQEKERYFTWSFMVFPKSLTSFMLIAFFPPFSFPFFLFFFLNKHFLQRQKQQVRINRTATMAMAIKAQGGTGREKETHTKRRWKTVSRVKFRNKHISLTAKPFSTKMPYRNT